MIPEWWPGGGETCCMDAGRVYCQWKGCGGVSKESAVALRGFGLSCGGCD